MGVNWTQEQKKAIEKSGCNLIVAAAAGSGKTAVLVERIVSIIESGKDVDSLLVTTFTDAAAKKMKQEIGDEIKKRLALNPDDKHLARQTVLLSRADICTIDSFCMRVVRSNFHKLDIDPDFKITDQNESELLLAQAADEVFAELYEQNDEGFYNLLDSYASQRGDAQLVDVVLSLCRFVRSMPDSKSWLQKQVDVYENMGSLFESEWGKVVLETTAVEIDGCIQLAREAYEYAALTDEMSSYTVPLENDIAALVDIKKVIEERDFNALATKMNAFSLSSGGKAKPKTPDGVKMPVAEKREYIKKHMAALADDFYYDSEQNIKLESEYAAMQVRAMCKVASLIEERFFEIKKKRGVLDFADIEHLALEILTDTDEDGNKVASEVALNLRNKYFMILVDEYQDSNELQETIFDRISNGDNIFMVGDIKQSIYRFRHTNPLLFKHKKDTYSDEEGINQRVIMSKNFRSRKEVINAVNFIMEQNASPLVGELVYDQTEALNAGATYPEGDKMGGAVEVHLIGDADLCDEFDDDESVFGAEAEAARVAKRILQLKREGFEVFDKKLGAMRKMRYSDVAILMRSPGIDAPVFADVLTQYGIPVFSDADNGYFVTEHIELMLSLLSVIDNPVQDIKLLALMRSPIGGFCDTELVDIRLCDSKADIYGALCACAKTEGALGKKCALLIEKIEKWREKSRHMPVHELIWYLYNDTGYYDIASAMDDVGKNRANLNLLIEYARSYEKTSFKGLFNFVNYAERIKNASRDVGGAKTIGENQDVVRIMSMHKSKGLEFGVVFVVRVAKNFNKMDLSNKILMHPELGIGVDFIDVQNRYKYPTFIKRAIKKKLYYELLSEEMRVLYVALTRAKEKLIVTVAPSKPESKKKKWLMGARSAMGKELPVFYTSSAMGMSDWIMPAIMRCESAREYVGEHISCPQNEADIILCRSEDSFAAVESEEQGQVQTDTKNYRELIEDRLGYVYAKQGALKVPTKVSVTEMKRIINNEIDLSQVNLYAPELAIKPAFMSEKVAAGGAERGSAMHFVLQHIDLNEALDAEGIEAQIEKMLEDKIIRKEQAELVDIAKAARFFESEMGRRMTASNNVVRELPFEIAIDAGDMGIDGAEGETVLLQGIIDCYFYEDDGVVLLDYKTDFVKNDGDIAKIKERYRLQLDMYEKALEKITGIKVKDKYLYLFSCESMVKY